MSTKSNLTKMLKHDFSFSYKVFFAMFAGVVLVFFALDMFLDVPIYAVTQFRALLMTAGITGVVIASYLQILMFFQRNFFGPEGYLMLTLPISRGKMLFSKILVSFVWFNFMMLLAPILIIIITPPIGDFWAAVGRVLSDPTLYIVILKINLAALALITLLFLTITFANSVVFGKKVHGVVAGVVSAGVHFFFLWLTVQILDRPYELTQVVRERPWGIWHENVPVAGLNNGTFHFERVVQIPLYPEGYLTSYQQGQIDFLFIGFAVGVCALCIAGILYLLKKRISLR